MVVNGIWFGVTTPLHTSKLTMQLLWDISPDFDLAGWFLLYQLPVTRSGGYSQTVNVGFFQRFRLGIRLSLVNLRKGKEMFYLTTHSTHFIYGYMASDIWLRTILIVRKETRYRHIGYSFRLTARVLLYAPSHRQDSTYHSLCYTSRGVNERKAYPAPSVLFKTKVGDHFPQAIYQLCINQL